MGFEHWRRSVRRLRAITQDRPTNFKARAKSAAFRLIFNSVSKTGPVSLPSEGRQTLLHRLGSGKTNAGGSWGEEGEIIHNSIQFAKEQVWWRVHSSSTLGPNDTRRVQREGKDDRPTDQSHLLFCMMMTGKELGRIQEAQRKLPACFHSVFYVKMRRWYYSHFWSGSVHEKQHTCCWGWVRVRGVSFPSGRKRSCQWKGIQFVKNFSQGLISFLIFIAQ